MRPWHSFVTFKFSSIQSSTRTDRKRKAWKKRKYCNRKQGKEYPNQSRRRRLLRPPSPIGSSSPPKNPLTNFPRPPPPLPFRKSSITSLIGSSPLSGIFSPRLSNRSGKSIVASDSVGLGERAELTRVLVLLLALEGG